MSKVFGQALKVLLGTFASRKLGKLSVKFSHGSKAKI
jgi:hypothetical protein